MGLQSCPGEVEEFWSGMSCVPIDTFAPSHHDLATRGAGAVADQAEERKKAKCAEPATTDHFVLLAVQTTGVFGSEAQMFF